MIERNEWVSGDSSIWNIDASYQTLRIQSRPRKIDLEIDVRSIPIKVRADLWHKQRRVSIGRNGISFGAERDLVIFRGMTFVGKSFSFNLCLEIEPGTRRVEIETLDNPTLKGPGIVQVGGSLEDAIQKYEDLKKD